MAPFTPWPAAASSTPSTLPPARPRSRRRSAAAAGDDNPFAALDGTEFGVDFNPVADRLRVVSDTGQNLRINVDTGDTITDGAITPASGSAQASAAALHQCLRRHHRNQLFVLDASTDLLHLQDPPNNGTLGAGLPLGIGASAVNGFDIDARNSTGYAVVGAAGAATLYSINLTQPARPRAWARWSAAKRSRAWRCSSRQRRARSA